MGPARVVGIVVVIALGAACSGSESATTVRSHGPLRVRATGLLIRDQSGAETQICVVAVEKTLPPRGCEGLTVEGVEDVVVSDIAEVSLEALEAEPSLPAPVTAAVPPGV